MQTTSIPWTDLSWNPIKGCQPISPACDHCYASRMAERMREGAYKGLTNKGVWNGKVAFDEASLGRPDTRRAPSRVFLCSMGDIFHEEVPSEWVDRVLHVIVDTPRHTFMMLTKRPERMHAYFAARPCPPNLWVGTTIENQTVAGARIRALQKVDAKVRFVSCEPLLGPLDLSPYLWIAWQCSACRGTFDGPYEKTCPDCGYVGGWCGSHHWNPPSRQRGRAIHWVIAGGESGPGARPSHPSWFRALRDQCKKLDVPYFFKSWGTWTPSGLMYNARARASQCAVHVGGVRIERIVKPDRSGCDWAFMVKGQKSEFLDGTMHREFPDQGGDHERE
jgi:protein gp37